jgi:hypothetical protein
MRRRNRAPVRTGFEREVLVDDDDDDDDDDGSELEWEEECLAPPAFQKHCLEWAISHATGGRNTPPHVAGGLDYLLRALLGSTVNNALAHNSHGATRRSRGPPACSWLPS